MRSDTLLKALDATVGRVLCLAIGWYDYLRSSGRSPGATPTPPTTDMSRRSLAKADTSRRSLAKADGHRILWIRPGGLGDMILLLPALQALRHAFPNALIDVLCESRNDAILPLADFKGEILHYDRDRLALWQRLRRNRYAVVIDTEQFHNLSAVLGRLSGAPCRIGFKINPVRNLLYTHLVNYALDAPESAQFMRLLEPFGLQDRNASVDGILADLAADIPAPAWLSVFSKNASPGNDVPKSRDSNTVAVYAGASTPYKQWPPERFQQVISFLTGELGLNVVLVGGRDAARISGELSECFHDRTATSPHVVSVVGRTSLRETAAVLRRVRFFMGADCGLTHLATAVGTPTVTLFGPSDPLKWGHRTGQHQILHRGLSCSPCFIFGYHRLCRTRDCMTEITADDVIAACRAVLDKKPDDC